MADIGVYQIRNTINGKRYIGGSTRLHERWLQHVSSLNRDAHNTKKLQDEWNEYGEQAFEFNVLLHCSSDDVFEIEQLVIKP